MEKVRKILSREDSKQTIPDPNASGIFDSTQQQEKHKQILFPTKLTACEFFYHPLQDEIKSSTDYGEVFVGVALMLHDLSCPMTDDGSSFSNGQNYSVL
jgi:hypothetical protein